jgi:hypothetical protein
MRSVLALAAAAASAAVFAVPAHAEQVDIGVHVNADFSASAYGTSTKPGETFGAFTVTRVAATDALADPVIVERPNSVPAIPGATTGTATYVVSAHPVNGDEPSPFFFTAVVVCTKAARFSCTQSAGEGTVISLLTGP